jgi:uncharacterized protein (TIGR02099 family)
MEVNAVLAWAKRDHDWQLQLNKLNLIAPGFNISAQGKVVIPTDQSAGIVVNFLAGIHAVHAENFLPNYLPLNHLSPKLAWWLSHGIVNGGTVDGVMALRGNPAGIPYPTHQGVFEFYAKVKDASIMPWKAWPVADHVDGTVHFDNHGFLAEADSGVMDGVTIKKVNISVDDMRKDVPATLLIHGTASASGNQAQTYLLDSPLKNKFQELFQILQLEGNVGLDLTLTFPLGHPEDAENSMNGVVSFNNNVIQLRAIPLYLDQIKGSINFTDETMDSQNLSAQLFGQPVNVGIATQMLPQGPERQVSVSTQLDTDALAQAYPWAAGLSGNIPLSFRFVDQDTENFFYLYADLTDLGSSLPAPLAKPIGMPLSFSMNGKEDEAGAHVHLELGSLFKASLEFQDDQNGLSFVNGIAAIDQTAALSKPAGSGLVVQGEIPYLSLEDWVDYLKAHAAPASSSQTNKLAFLDFLPRTTVKFANLDIYGQNYNDLSLTLSRGTGDTALSVAAPLVEGSILIPDQMNQTWQAKLDYLSLQANQQASEPAISSAMLKSVPPLKLAVKALSIGKVDWGNVSLNTTPLDNGISLDALNVVNPNFSLTLKGSQVAGQGKEQVQLQGNLTAENFGAALSQIGYNNVMIDGKGPIGFNFTWQGSINTPEINTLNGNLNFALKDGSLSDVNPGISRLLGLLNINSWWRRLQLNFSDVTGKGLGFDTLSADVSIKNGVASTSNLALSGPGVSINSSGDIDLVNKTIDQTLVVMPQTAGGLALVAGVVGGPIVGVATWAADSLLSNTVLKGRGLKYHVSGVLGKPEFTEE